MPIFARVRQASIEPPRKDDACGTVLHCLSPSICIYIYEPFRVSEIETRLPRRENAPIAILAAYVATSSCPDRSEDHVVVVGDSDRTVDTISDRIPLTYSVAFTQFQGDVVEISLNR